MSSLQRASVAALILLVGCSAPKAGAPGAEARSWKLFIDDHWVEARSGVRRVLHQPRKHPANPLIRGEQNWSRNPYCYGSVLFDEETSEFKLWYMSYNRAEPVAERSVVLYATSVNGIDWIAPSLGLFPFSGSTRNNIVLKNYGHSDLYAPSVIKDEGDPDPSRRYKMTWWDFPHGTAAYVGENGLCVAFSPDGIHWSRYSDNPVLPAWKRERSISDVMSVMLDRRSGKYVVHAKGWADPFPAFRQIVRTESSDFIHWSEPEVVVRHAFDEKDPQSYGMSVAQYEGVYLGLLSSYKSPGDQTIDIQLAVSHDNRRWERVADQATFLPNGPPGSWDDGMLFCAPLIVHGDRILIYYGGWDGPHNGKRSAAIGLATLRKDGFVSLDAGAETGRVRTKRLPGSGGSLYVNVDARGGEIRVAVLGENGRPLPGYAARDCVPLASDGIAQRIEWRAGSELPGDSVRLEFELRDASLYSFRTDGS